MNVLHLTDTEMAVLLGAIVSRMALIADAPPALRDHETPHLQAIASRIAPSLVVRH